MALPRHPLAVSFSRATKCGEAEAGEGYTEDCNYLFCSAQTSLTLASYQNSDPEKHIEEKKKKKAERKKNRLCGYTRLFYRSRSVEEPRLTCGLEERLEAAGDKAKRQNSSLTLELPSSFSVFISLH